MKKSIFRYSALLGIVLFFSYFMYINQSKEELKNYLDGIEKEKIVSKVKELSNVINNQELIIFKNYLNLEKINFVRNSKVIYSSEQNEIGKEFELKDVRVESKDDFIENGFWFKDENRYELYYPLDKEGIIALELKVDNDFIASRILSATHKYFLYLLAVILLLVIIFNIYNFHYPFMLVKKFLKGFYNPLMFHLYEKRVNSKHRGESTELIELMNSTFDTIKNKTKMVEEDRQALKKIYEIMKVKNERMVSLYEIAKSLSYELEIDKIYEKINKIIQDLMGGKILVILVKVEDGYQVDYIQGVAQYRNGIVKNSIEKIVEKFGKAIKVRDAKTDNRVDFSKLNVEDQQKLNEIFVVPLISEEKIIGIMITDKIFRGQLKHSEEIITLGTFGEIAARSIAKAKKFRDMNLGLNVTSMLYKITTLVEMNKDMNFVFKKMLDSVKQVVNYSAAAIYLLDDKGDLKDKPEYRVGKRDEILESVEFKLGKGIKALVAQRHETVIIKDVRESAKGFREIFDDSSGSEIASFTSVPMFSDDELIGIVNLTHNLPDMFQEEDKQILRLFANQAASTINKAKKDRKIEELLAQVTNEAITDQLTKLYNRRFMMKRLTEEIERAKREDTTVGMIAVDIDHFKRFNDTYGHQIGDLVLQETARVLTDSLRVMDIACRYGGEEFFAILPGIDLEGIQITAERIRANVEKNIVTTNNNNLRVTISVGAAIYPMNAYNGETLIKNADQALYMAKENGRNRVVIYGK